MDTEVIKILHLTQASGGVKTYIDSILQNSDQKKFLHLLVSGDLEFCEEVQKNGKNAFFVSMRREPSLVQDFKALIKLYQIVRKNKVDLIHCHSAKGGVLGRICGFISGTKVIFTPNAFSYLGFSGLKRTIYLTIEKLLSYFTNYFLGVSNSEYIRALTEVNYRKSKAGFVSNSIRKSKKSNFDYRSKQVIGMIGRVTHQKNPLEFAFLAKRIIELGYNYKFVLLGVGFHDHLLNDFNTYVEENKLQAVIEAKKWGSYSTMEEFFTSIDIFVLTSAFEGLPFSLLEAMEFGLPCVVSDADGNRDAIESGSSGFIYKSREELIDLTTKLILDKSLRENIGLAARNRVIDHFDSSKNVAQIDRIYRRVMDSKN